MDDGTQTGQECGYIDAFLVIRNNEIVIMF